MSVKIWLMHGVNLDKLVGRDAMLAPVGSLGDLESMVLDWGVELDVEVVPYHTNDEADFIRELHGLYERANGLIINAGAWGHYSWALYDALRVADVPTVEVHMSDTCTRESWRRNSVVADLCLASIHGEGAVGYRRALEVLAENARG